MNSDLRILEKKIDRFLFLFFTKRFSFSSSSSSSPVKSKTNGNARTEKFQLDISRKMLCDILRRMRLANCCRARHGCRENGPCRLTNERCIRFAKIPRDDAKKPVISPEFSCRMKCRRNRISTMKLEIYI